MSCSSNIGLFVLYSAGFPPLPPFTLPRVVPGVGLPPSDFVLPPYTANVAPAFTQDMSYLSHMNSSLTKPPANSSVTTSDSINITMSVDPS